MTITSDSAVTVRFRPLLRRRLPTRFLVLSLPIVAIILSVRKTNDGNTSRASSSSSSSSSLPYTHAHAVATNGKIVNDVTIIGDPVNVWSSVDSFHKCQNRLIDVPDIPTRVWYSSSNNKANMIQGSTDYHTMGGPDLLNVSRSCDVSWNKTGSSDPSMFAGNEFLDSTFAFTNNRTVVSLVHTEYPGDNYNNCIGPAYPRCWTVTLGLMVSHDDGRTWDHARPPPHHVVAVVPYKYSPDSDQKAFGWGDPTNILFDKGYWYVAAWNRNTISLQKAGVCMMRTNSILDPSSWRGWNGSHWSVAFRSPYNENDDDDSTSKWDPSDHICQVLDIGDVNDPTSVHIDPTQCNPFGLVRHESTNLFLMTWACLNGKEFYMTTSTDLIHWSTPESIYNHEMLPHNVAKNVTSIHYPNLMDIKAPDALGDNNYYTIGDQPYLFWVSFGHNVYVDGRSVWATPISIEIDSDGDHHSRTNYNNVALEN